MIKCRHRVAEVQIDGLALIKLVKHCRDALPNMVAGSLLGLDQGSTLEVTHCFPFLAPKSAPEHEDVIGAAEEDVDGEAYQMEMMKMLREVNVDNNCVGWYKSIYAGSFCQSPLVETQFSYQDNLCNNCVVLLYDPSKTTNGLNVKAYQLSQEFVAAYRAGSNSFVSPSSVLVELPLKVRNPGLITAFLFDVHKSCQTTTWPGLEKNVDYASLERNLEHCSQWVDDLVEEQSKFQSYLRSIERYKEHLRWHGKRRGEPDDDEVHAPLWKNTTEPLRLDTLLITNQVRQYCLEMNSQSNCTLSMLQSGTAP